MSNGHLHSSAPSTVQIERRKWETNEAPEIRDGRQSVLDVNTTNAYIAGVANRFSDQIRQAVDASDMSRYRICKLTGIDQAIMSRFMAGAGMELANIDRLAGVLKLTVKHPAKQRVRKAR